MGPFSGVLSHKLVSLILAVSIYLLSFFSFFSSGLRRYGGSLKKNDKNIIFLESEKDVRDMDNDVGEEEKSEVHLKFKFPSFEEFISKARGNFFDSEMMISSNSKHDFAYGKSFLSAFLEEVEIFPVKEIYGNKIGDFSENEDVFSDRNIVKVYEETGDFQEKGKLVMGFDGEENEKKEAVEFSTVQEEEEFLDESVFCSEKNSDCFLSEGDFGGELNVDIGENENLVLTEYFADVENDIMEEDKNLEQHSLQNPNVLNSDFLSEKDFDENLDHINDVEFVIEQQTRATRGDSSENPKPKDSSTSDSLGDGNRLESLWEHQELIEQLKMELRKARATGLPTILEESESPKIIDDLKPWNIDEKFQHEDCMDELHKFYKSYREMMRKFDILNYQKMYAMGFLQLKDPFQSTTSHHKPSIPTLKSLVSENLWLFKHKTHESDPIKKFINELQGDLEVVYVGQMCLSWEFLHWQYEKTLDLWNSDPHGVHWYNEVAGEFQQFQVLVQRFIEDEPFHGPRVQSYVKSRCVLRNLLQVPVIREDNLKDKRKNVRKKDKDEYVITSDTLVEILEESIRIFWLFVQSDKDCYTQPINGHKGTPELQNSEDLKLLVDVRKVLQKKEKKLKDILRSENCILKKFRQRKEDDSDQVLYFFSQVDMKLVSRVLNMSKITRDQLIWCQNKLSRISFVNRKIYVEPAFLLFPC